MTHAAEIVLPDGDGPHPAVVLGAEAFGVNTFIRGIQQRLTQLGYAVAVPDYYRGEGPAGKDSYDDFTEVTGYIRRLDFTRGARDLAAAVDALRSTPRIDPRRVAVWGYCTGGTLAWLAACLRGDVAAAVLYFPSQPVFAALTPRTPVNPVDLLWQLTCPALFIYGDDDKLLTPGLLADMRARIRDWDVDAQVNLYPGAGHSFTCPWGPMRNEEADHAAWNDAITFLSAKMGA